jgi:TetR/AcrR family fatty acid metabolism transcriptional regulator
MSSAAAAVRVPHPPRGRPPTPGRRQSILRAAEDIFTRHDFHEVQMDDVASACGVGKGTLYRYFRSKRELYLAVMFGGIDRLRGEIEAAVRTVEPPREQIEHIVRRTLGYFWDRRRFFALIHQHEHKLDADSREWLRQRGQLVRLVQDALDHAIAAGHVRPVDSRIAAEMLFGMMRAANRYRAREDDLDSLVAAVVDVFLRGVGTPAGRRSVAGRGRRS